MVDVSNVIASTVCAEVHLASLLVSSSTPLLSGVGRLYEPQEPWGCTLTQNMDDTLTQNMGLDGTIMPMGVEGTMPLVCRYHGPVVAVDNDGVMENTNTQ